MENNYLKVLLESLLDSLYIFICIFLVYVLLSFIEDKLAKKIEKKAGLSPLLGASIGLIPQCGFSIVCADLYKKKHLSIGCLIAVFIACSDEAIPILLSNPDSFFSTILIIFIKFIVAIFFGYLIDFIYRSQKLKEKTEKIEITHHGCCHHEIEHHHESSFKSHIIHPLVHSIKIGLYVFIINLIFSSIIYFIGEETIKSFLNQNIYFTPFLASLIGLIPNCASSVIISELYISSSISLAATISGLICNAGLGIMYLFKDKKMLKSALSICGILVLIANIVGYIILFIEQL